MHSTRDHHDSAEADPLLVEAPEQEYEPPFPVRAFIVRALALLCACSLSVGSHYAQYILGPLKSRLSREMGTDNTEFSLLISAFSLNSTWTPLVGGILAGRLGTTYTSILATGVIFLGQTLLLIGNLASSVRLMTFGLFVFGLGVSPLAVVQETIIVRFFRSHGLGVSLALGLVAGKGASFIAARTSYPLSERFGPHAPFYMSTLLTAVSFAVNLVYLFASNWLVRGANAELEPSELRVEALRRKQAGAVESLSEAEALKKVAEKRKVSIRDMSKLGDVFWAYIGLNVLCGAIWAPFAHLAANIIERRFAMTELDASTTASYALSGSVILYPMTGCIVDHVKKRGIVVQLLMISSALTLLCYLWLALPPQWTKTPDPAIASFAIGHGFSPLLLVVIVPQLVPHKYISTTLGAHKALEQTGFVIFQTLAGVMLDLNKKKAVESAASDHGHDVQYLLNAFLVVNLAQLAGIFGLAHLERRQKEAAFRRANALLPPDVHSSDEEEAHDWLKVTDENRCRRGSRVSRSRSRGSIFGQRSDPPTSSSEQVVPLRRDPSLPPSHHRLSRSPIKSYSNGPVRAVRTKVEVRRGQICSVLCGVLICFAWVLFLSTAWLRLRSKEERASTTGFPTTS
ncbi:MFS general substrate transporter [Sparassis latifolia]